MFFGYVIDTETDIAFLHIIVFSSSTTVSIEGRDLVERMLHADPEKRISASHALKHAWIKRRAPEASWEEAKNPEATAGDGACMVQ